MTPVPVFTDATGRRWRRLRRLSAALGIVSSLAALVVIAGVLVPPLLPNIALGLPARIPGLPRLHTTREQKIRDFVRHAYATHGVTPPRGVRPERYAPIRPRQDKPGGIPTHPVTAGFYVNWDENSRASVFAHADRMDWIIGEWAFIAPSSDSILTAIDPRIVAFTQALPAARRPQLLAMVSNYDSTLADFNPVRVRRLTASRRAEAAVVRQLAGVVRRYALGGVMLDLENLDDSDIPAYIAFVRRLRSTLTPMGAVTVLGATEDASPAMLSALAAAADRVVYMVYDEHYGRGDPGPVAGQDWYLAHLQRALPRIPPAKLVLAVGAYGYDWNDADTASTEMTFQDVMTAARDNRAQIHFDSTALNPYIMWSDPDSTDHVVWYLDAATAYNQLRAGTQAGIGGYAVWRLGSEDPALWRVLARGGQVGPPDSLEVLPTGYDVEMKGEGEILRVAYRPSIGRRALTLDPQTHLVTSERILSYPSPWIVRRSGALPHRVALTFDDGPDGTWTPMILDTLRSRNARATFFLIGDNVEEHIPLVRREYEEGHEFGNHTFTHPNLALTSDFVTRLELSANERLLEAVLDHRSALFRPPYFGDAEPTTADELVPVGLASDLGYVTAGLHIDSQDWMRPGTERIIRNVLDHLNDGHVVLLHDAGGDRAQTVAALGPLIDSLRARGDTLVLMSDLAGITPAQAMPGLPPRSAFTRLIELGFFAGWGLLEWVLYWVFYLAVVLGLARLLFITGLAAIQRRRAHAARRDAADDEFAPAVSVIVPAYNEAKVINRTIESLLAQDYAGDLEVVVVDDGSPDDTAGVARARFGQEARVSIYRKPNGGKASALNYGIERARGDIVVGLDADTIFPPETIRALVQPLRDRHVGAVAGNAKVGNRVNLITRWQALEYVTSQNLDRRAFSLLDCITVVPGAVGAWRKELVLRAGGFSEDTLAEDQDLTLAIRELGFAVAYADDAVAYTEAPDSVRALSKQRFRWSFGTLQCLWKHRHALLRRRYGTLGFVAMPNNWLFQIVFPAISPLADLLFLWSLWSVWLVREEHGLTYAMTNLWQVVTLYVVFLLVDWLAAVVAFLMEPREDRSLTWLIFLQRFAYRQIMYVVVIRSVLAAVRGRLVGWGKLERKDTVRVPA